MTKEYTLEETESIKFKSKNYDTLRTICPDCLEHEQGEIDEVYDCKNIITDDRGKTVGQCCCYSKEHGIRQD